MHVYTVTVTDTEINDGFTYVFESLVAAEAFVKAWEKRKEELVALFPDFSLTIGTISVQRVITAEEILQRVDEMVAETLDPELGVQS